MFLSLILVFASVAAQAQGPQTTPGSPSGLGQPDPMRSVQVQLGAYDTREEAHGALASFRRDHPDLVGDRTTLIIEAESGGQVFFRLRLARLGDMEEARALCEGLIARDVSCIPVMPR
jgi:hypothetical protein